MERQEIGAQELVPMADHFIHEIQEVNPQEDLNEEDPAANSLTLESEFRVVRNFHGNLYGTFASIPAESRTIDWTTRDRGYKGSQSAVSQGDVMDKQKKLKWAVTGLLVAIAAIAAPIFVLAVKGVVALSIAVIVGLALVNFAPLIGDAFAIWKMKGTRALASANPIETMLIEWNRMMEGLEQQKQALVEFEAAVRVYLKKVADLIAKVPERRAEFLPQVEARIALVQMRWELWEDSKAQLKAMKEKIDEEQMVWDTAQADLAVSKLDASIKGSPLTEIKLKEATESVAKAAALSFSKLNSSMRDMDFDPSKKLSITNEAKAKASELLGLDLRQLDRVELK